MKKWFLMLACLLMAAPMTVSASARLDGMAAIARGVEDIDLIWLYPNKILDYRNTVDFRLGEAMDPLSSEDNHWGGVIAEEPGLGVFAVYVNRPSIMPSSWSTLSSNFFTPPMTLWPSALSMDTTPTGGFFLLGLLGREIDVFWADSLGEGVNFGVHLNYLDAFKFLGPNADSQAYGLGLGLGLSGGVFSQSNFHLDYQFQNITGTLFAPPASHDNGIFSFMAGFLGSADWEKNLFMKTYVDFRADQADPGGLFPFAIGVSDWNVVLGTTLNHSFMGGKGLISTGLTLGYSNNHFNDPTNALIGSFNEVLYQLVWNACLEAGVTNWLTLRTGAAKNLVARAYHSVNTGTATWDDFTGDPVVFRTGFSVNWQDFTLDASFDMDSINDNINHPQPGGGLFFPSTTPLAAMSADLKFKF